MTGNITIDPLARATAVDDPKIREVRDLKSGLIFDACSFIRRLRYDRFVQVRSQLKEAIENGSPRLVCSICGTAAYLVSSTTKSFFFRHQANDGSCPARTREGLSEHDVRALKYKGASESDAHKRLKKLIERSLRADPNFETIEVERVWRGQRDPASLRRPDVQAYRRGLRIAFEAQLSTTFLDVVVGRKTFYRNEGGLLVWVLPRFDPTYRQLTVDDILFNNNSNVLVVNEESAMASEEAGQLMVRCAFRWPILSGDNIETAWDSRLVAWSDLTLDLVKQRVFAFDTEAEEEQLERQRDAARITARETQEHALRRVALGVMANQDFDNNWTAWCVAWEALRESAGVIEGHLPYARDVDQRLRNIVRGVASGLAGYPIGYRFDRLVQVAHHVADNCPEALVLFGRAIQLDGHRKTLKRQDKNGRWEAKASRHRDALRAGDPRYRLADDLRPFLMFLFPELASAINAPSRST